MPDFSSRAIAVSIPEACRIVGFSRAKLYREINSGRLPARKAGYRTLIRMTDLRAYVDALPKGGPVERSFKK